MHDKSPIHDDQYTQKNMHDHVAMGEHYERPVENLQGCTEDVSSQHNTPTQKIDHQDKKLYSLQDCLIFPTQYKNVYV